MKDIILFAGDIAVLMSFPALALFIGFYYFRSPWKKLLVGRSLMYFALSLMLVVIAVNLNVWFGADYPGREWVRLLSFAGAGVMSWRLFFTLRHIQKQPPEDSEEVVKQVNSPSDSAKS